MATCSAGLRDAVPCPKGQPSHAGEKSRDGHSSSFSGGNEEGLTLCVASQIELLQARTGSPGWFLKIPENVRGALSGHWGRRALEGSTSSMPGLRQSGRCLTMMSHKGRECRHGCQGNCHKGCFFCLSQTLAPLWSLYANHQSWTSSILLKRV